MFNLEDYKNYLESEGDWKYLDNFKGAKVTKEDFINSLCQYEQKPYELISMSRASFSKYVNLVYKKQLEGKPNQAAPAKYLLHGYGFRKCGFCNKILSLNSFYARNSKANWDGLRTDCKKCELKETKLEQNRDIINNKAKKYRDNNKEKIRYYRQINSELINSYTARRRAKIKSQIGSEYSLEEEVRYRKIAKYLTKRYNETFVIDHYIPIASGGLHEPSNWQIITEKENLSKNKKDPKLFYSSSNGVWFLKHKKGIRKYSIDS